ncbi:COG complex component COG2 [Trichophyton interdigitale]|uniref:Conserved oligomeric Golgi complex subunit 2 n=1 Tax=Trichophyton interdigitale TaxID=101480 RepID=A0A9P4YM15_9EURO|nr:COG complex component COG2 [Trichophyton interdigitale]KAF3901026.1 COG complex component COG2 [Trichophyton interdigitale]KAG8208911.1 COG complex component COG2 [Trichophyton interdigitale]
MSRFYFGDSDGSDNDLNDDNLPFPKPISRASFLTPDFDATTFLASLSNRHQSLADLQTELRELNEALNKELLDLVNENYQEFLSLGASLKGGQDKVEEVRAGLLGFQRNVQGIKDQFEAKKKEIRECLDEKKRLRSKISVGYELLDVAERIELLETNLMIRPGKDATAKENGAQGADDEGDGLSDVILGSETDDSDEGGEGSENDSGNKARISLHRLEAHIQQYLSVKVMADRIGEKHPFISSHAGRIDAIKSALLLDLSTALKETSKLGSKRDEKFSTILRLYDSLGHHDEGQQCLKRLGTIAD